jgi:hypothetical protein
MKKIYYEKRGRRYVPVAEYDSDLMDAFHKGTHLVQVYPGGKTTRYNIDPSYAPIIAASRVAENAMCDAIHQASELRPKRKLLTQKQMDAWNHLIEVFGEEARCLDQSSARDIAEAGVTALQKEADKLMKHESVRHAYEQFLLVCKLTKENENV